MAGLAGAVLVAKIVGSVTLAGGANFNVEAGAVGITQLDAWLAVRAFQPLGDGVLGEFNYGHIAFKKNGWVEVGNHDPRGVTVAGQCLPVNHHIKLGASGMRIHTEQGQHLAVDEVSKASADGDGFLCFQSGPGLGIIEK